MPPSRNMHGNISSFTKLKFTFFFKIGVYVGKLVINRYFFVSFLLDHAYWKVNNGGLNLGVGITQRKRLLSYFNYGSYIFSHEIFCVGYRYESELIDEIVELVCNTS